MPKLEEIIKFKDFIKLLIGLINLFLRFNWKTNKFES